MIHLAVPQVDAGPVAAFCRYPIRGGAWDALWSALDDPRRLDDAALDGSALGARIREAQMAYEAPLLVSALQAFADGRMRVVSGRIVDAQGRDAPPLDLTADVEARRAHGL